MTTGSEALGAQSRRLGRAGLTAIGVLALGLLTWGVLTQHGYAVLPPGAEAELPRPVQVDGVEANTSAELDHLMRLYAPGTVFRVEAGGKLTRQLASGPSGRRAEARTLTLTLERELSGSLLVITWLGAFALWLVCTFALAPRMGKPGIADLYASLMLGAFVIATGGTTVPHGASGYVLSLLFLLSAAGMGPLFVRFSLVFPRPPPARTPTQATGTALLLLGAGIALWNMLAWLRAVAAPGATGVAATAAPADALYLLLALCLVIACFNLYRSSRTAPLDRERRQAKWVLWGLAIGTAPYVLFRALPRVLFGVDPPWPPAVDRVIEMTVPLAFAVAVARERFLDIDVVIRRSLLYTLLALAGAALLFGTALLLAEVVFEGLGLPNASSTWAWAIAGALTGLLFRPGRRAIGRWVDRTFFRIRHAHDEALALLERDLATARSQAEAAPRLGRFLDEALAPKASLALVLDGEAPERAGELGAGLDDSLLLDACRGEAELLARVDATGEPEAERADFPPSLASAGVRLVQPIRAGDAQLGLLAVGEKRTERHYLTEDLSALRAAAALASSGLERMGLVQQAAEEVAARRTLAQLAKQKTEFFARLAHDLRTPITAVQWSTRNLLDGLPGPLTSRQRTYLEGVGASAGQLARLVANLVDLGRLDLGVPERPMEPVDGAAVAREVAAALESIAQERQATIHLELEEDLPPIRGRKEAAFQILINLVDNALKYTAPETRVEVVLRTDDDAKYVVLSVRDHGPGLPGDPEVLFALFRQGPESPYTQVKGFGIGLHVVQSWTESLGGRVEAQNASDGGARFTCRLPRWRGEGVTCRAAC